MTAGPDAGRYAATVAAYYGHIDRGDLDWVLALFAPDAVYERADARYAGLAEIGVFFRERRRIRGTHTVDRVIADAPARCVVATGVFDGVGAEGDVRRVGFADVWEFDASARVTRRTTYLALGHQYVER